MQLNDTDPRILRTRKLIIDAFLALVNEKNFESVTVKDIAERATVNRATFYAHFQDKYILLEYIIGEAFQLMVSNRLPSSLSLTEASGRELILAICEYQDAVYKQCRLDTYTSMVPVVESTVRSHIQQIVRNMLETSIAITGRDAGRIALVATMISSSIFDATKLWVMDNQPLAPEALAEKILPFVMAGMRAALAP